MKRLKLGLIVVKERYLYNKGSVANKTGNHEKDKSLILIDRNKVLSWSQKIYVSFILTNFIH